MFYYKTGATASQRPLLTTLGIASGPAALDDESPA